MKKVLLIASILVVGACQAKCINSSHNTTKNNATSYNCAIKNNDSGSFSQVSANASTSMVICKNCGCDVKMHDSE